jgi:hypothetical protein
VKAPKARESVPFRACLKVVPVDGMIEPDGIIESEDEIIEPISASVSVQHETPAHHVAGSSGAITWRDRAARDRHPAKAFPRNAVTPGGFPHTPGRPAERGPRF